MSMKMNYKCLMIETSDKKKLFTYKKNYPHLIEFSRAIGAEVSLVQVEKAEVLEIQELAPILCASTTLHQEQASYTLLEPKIPKPGRKIISKGRERDREIAQRVKAYIEAEFLIGNEVSIKYIKNKFKGFGLSNSALSHHLAAVRKTFEKSGRKIKKTGRGRYFL